MAAPSATARGTPEGRPLRDGYSSKITLGQDATIELWEKSVKPPGIDGGEPVDNTTMHNSTWRTSRPRQLKTVTPITCRASYDPDIYDELTTRINFEDVITVTFADGTTIALYGYLQKFEPAEMVEGTEPEGTFTFVVTNWDADEAAGSEEVGFALTEVSGT